MSYCPLETLSYLPSKQGFREFSEVDLNKKKPSEEDSSEGFCCVFYFARAARAAWARSASSFMATAASLQNAA